MRDEYINKLKEFIVKNPDFKSTQDELRITALTMGASDAEMQEALRQLSSAYIQETEKSSSIPSSMLTAFPTIKKFFVLDFFLQLLLTGTLLFILISIGRQITTLQIFQSQPKQIAIKQQPVTPFVPNALVKPVFANTEPVSGKKIFSFPPSHVTLTYKGETPKREVLGFLPYWMLEFSDKINIDPITTVSLFGLDLDESGNFIAIDETGRHNGGWDMINNLKLGTFISKAKSKKIKMVLTIKSFSNTITDKFVVSDAAQKTFISNALQLINTNSLDGINLDFEYIGTPTPEVITGFTRFVANLNTEMKRQVPHATLTIDTYVTAASNPGLVDVEAVANQSDALVIMGYDVHTPSGGPGPLAPMGGDLNLIGFLQNYLEKVPANKIILAVPYYGYDWPQTRTAEDTTHVLPYAELAEVTNHTDILWDDLSQSPWYKYVNPKTNVIHEVHFENIRSLGIKYDYVNKKDLAGIGIWALGYDGLNNELALLIGDKFTK